MTTFFNLRSGLVAIILVVFFGVLVFGFGYETTAQTLSEEDQARREQLEKELEEVEREIMANQRALNARLRESASIERDIDVLTYQIQQSRLNIRSKEIEIQNLGGDIDDRQETIEELSVKIDQEKDSLAQMIRQTREMDDINLMEVVLASDGLSDLFVDMDAFYFMQQSMHQLFENIREAQRQTKEEKVVLEQKRNAEIDARHAIEAEKAAIERAEREKQELLRISRSEEDAYREILSEREAEKQAIKNALFQLRDTPEISFGEALELAQQVQRQTGVRAAFLLAIITQESNLGQNVGTCNRPGDSLTWREIMPGPEDQAAGRSSRNDQAVYLRLMDRLGLDPDTQPLSCPLGFGWGGAMGPSQFIPTTWEPYQSRITAVTGNNPPNPWNPLDAFTASGLLLRDLGAASGGFSAERHAALRYYAGGNWNDPRNAFYGDAVMNIASRYERDIEVLQN